MVDFPVGGSAAYMQVGKEATYAAVATTNVAFGHNQKVTVDRNINSTPVYGLGSPYASANFAGLFEGKLTITFDLASTYWLELAMGTCTDVDDGSFGYSHTYADNTGYVATSFSLENGINLDTDALFKYLGCVVDTFEMVSRIGEATHVTVNAPYANETLATTGLDTTPASDAEDLLIFSEGSVQLPSGTTLARVQSITLRGIKNAQLIPGLGSRIPSKAIWKTMIFEFDMELSFENDDMVVALYGQATGPLTATNPAAQASLILTWSNGAATTSRRSLTMTFGSTHIGSDSLPQAVEEHLVQSVKGYCIGAPTSIIGIDNTAANPL